MTATRPATANPHAGFSITEVMITVAVIGILTAVGINASGNEWRREQVNAVAIDLSGWLETVRRASLRGNTCFVRINGGSLSTGSTLAQASEIITTFGGSSPYGSGSTITNNCLNAQPLTISNTVNSSATYTVSPSSTTDFTITPRGTVNTTTLNVPLTTPIVIQISLAGTTGPMRCVRISPGLGMVTIGSSNTTSTTCPDSSYGGSF